MWFAMVCLKVVLKSSANVGLCGAFLLSCALGACEMSSRGVSPHGFAVLLWKINILLFGLELYRLVE